MQSLFDLLAALPDDEAEELRAAFRAASEANRLRDGESAQQKAEIYGRLFREYAHLHEKRRGNSSVQRPAARPRRPGKSKSRKLAANVLTIAALTAAFAGAAVLSESIYMQVFVENITAKTPSPADPPTGALKEPSPAASAIEPPRDPEEIGRETLAAISHVETAPPADAAPKAETTLPLDLASPAATTPKAETAPKTGPPEGVADLTNSTAAVERTSEVNDVELDARHYRDRAVRAYKAGDIYIALACFDIAIEKDPNFSDAYIDRAIVHYRMGNFTRAFADVAHARQIDESRHESNKASSK